MSEVTCKHHCTFQSVKQWSTNELNTQRDNEPNMNEHVSLPSAHTILPHWLADQPTRRYPHKSSEQLGGKQHWGIEQCGGDHLRFWND
eukprot:1294235-Amphidinium_carterae.1